MSLWEYKVITSGKGGFATPALLEKFLNDLGREEWEIVQFRSHPDNFLAFTGLARRTTQRDWTLADAAAAAAKAEADKLRAEFEAKFKAATTQSSGTEERPASFLEEKLSPDDGFRKPVDTSRDDEPEEESKDDDDWDKLTAAEEDELPTFFDAIKPHMRRNQRGPGMSVGVDFLAKKWEQNEEDLKGALAECGFTIPEDEDAKPEYLEFEGDLYWVNVNRRGELWINTKEKPRPVFRAVKAQKVVLEEEPKPERAPKPERQERRPEATLASEAPAPTPDAPAPAESEPTAPVANQPNEGKPEAPGQSLPEGPALLEKLRPFMRRNRRGPGGSGSASFLCRALKCREADLVAGFKALGLVVPTSANEKPTNVEIGNGIWWVNIDSRGNVWINGRDKKPGETIENAPQTRSEAPVGEFAPVGGGDNVQLAVVSDTPAESTSANAAPDAVPTPEIVPTATVEVATAAPSSEPAPSVAVTGENATLAGVRPLLKETRTGSLAGKLDRLADGFGKSTDELVALLITAGLVVPEKPREKPQFVEHAGEIYWLTRNAKGELWLNAKVSKFAGKKPEGEASGASGASTEDTGEKKPRRPRGRRKTD